MKMTQRDYEERLARVSEGTADDEDHRLVKHYQREGWTSGNTTADGSWLFTRDEGAPEGDAEFTEEELDRYADRRIQDLQKLARDRELSPSGNKSDVIGRLIEFDRNNAGKD